MCYDNCVIWDIMPKESFKIIRNCPKCGYKSKYINTESFRVNANGKSVDVWLIYQCEKCKSTLNIEIYERIPVNKISTSEYEKFLSNNKELAFYYGVDREVLKKNKAEIETEDISYEIVKSIEDTDKKRQKDQSIIIKNQFQLKLRVDKIISEQLNISRQKVKFLIENGEIYDTQGNELKRYFTLQKLEISIKSKQTNIIDEYEA